MPICGAANPAPSSASIVSCMSRISASSSGVLKSSTFRATSSNRGSPIRSTGLIAIELHHAFENIPDTRHRLFQNGMRIFQTDGMRARFTASGIVCNYGNSRIAEAQFFRQGGFRHAGHAYHIDPVTLQPVDLSGGLQTGALGRAIDTPIDHL